MGLIDGATRDECLALEDQLQSYAANEQWIQAWNINGQGLVPPIYLLLLIQLTGSVISVGSNAPTPCLDSTATGVSSQQPAEQLKNNSPNRYVRVTRDPV